MFELSATEIWFWAVLLVIAYTLKGYPVLLGFLASIRKKPEYPEATERPMVSFVVAAYNEEKNIIAKLDNLLHVDYDRDKIEFLIGSDESTDRTDEILAEASGRDGHIRHFRLDRRGGKIAVLHKAVQLAQGEIIVFTDCSVKTDPDIMPIILSCFHDRRVGLVSSRDVWIDETDGSPLSQHKYIDYEMNIRRLESRFNSLVSASGSFFAVRRELFRSYGSDQADDFALPLQIYRQGYKVIHRDDLVGYVPMVKSSGAELARRTRIVQAGIRTVLANLALLNPLRYPVFAWQLWSHKVLKWLFPFMVFASIVLGIVCWDEGFVYQIIVAIYLIIAILGIIGFFVKGRGAARLPATANFLLLSSLAVVAGWYKVICGGAVSTWEPTHR